ncbi:unnamed protein product [Urochloa humidicola]
MSDTLASVESSSMAALNNASAAALISVDANAAASTAAASTQGVNIRGLIPITLDMQSTCYRRWKSLFRIVLGRFDLLSHIDSDTRRSIDSDLTVVMWLHATLADDLMDMIMVEDPTTPRVWTTIETIFNNNKPSRAVDLEAELHSLVQGDLSVSAYCHQLQHLAHGLTDSDQPVSDRVLVHQLICGLDARFATLKTLLPALPQFPSFSNARSHLLREECAQLKKSSSSTESALISSDGSSSSTNGASGDGTRHDNGGRGNSSNDSRGGHNGGRGGGRGHSSNNNSGRGQQQQQQSSVPALIPYYPHWGGVAWRLPGPAPQGLVCLALVL